MPDPPEVGHSWDDRGEKYVLLSAEMLLALSITMALVPPASATVVSAAPGKPLLMLKLWIQPPEHVPDPVDTEANRKSFAVLALKISVSGEHMLFVPIWSEPAPPLLAAGVPLLMVAAATPFWPNPIAHSARLLLAGLWLFVPQTYRCPELGLVK